MSNLHRNHSCSNYNQHCEHLQKNHSKTQKQKQCSRKEQQNHNSHEDEELYAVRNDSIKGFLKRSRSSFEGFLEGAPEVGFLMDAKINDRTYKGFLLHNFDKISQSNSNDIKAHSYEARIYQNISKQDLDGAETMVNLGRSFIVDCLKKPPLDSIDSWICYFSGCSKQFECADLLTKHIRNDHFIQNSTLDSEFLSEFREISFNFL